MKKILIVDDAAFIRLTLKQILERNGIDVVGEGENGLVGVQKFKELAPDLVTLDITMPEMDGLGALQAIKAIKPDARVVMVSAMGQESIVRQAIMAGASAFIVKPFKEEHVMKTISKLLNI
jgi:two-component system, chemotaxis family, chemotaxis protein CheY